MATTKKTHTTLTVRNAVVEQIDYLTEKFGLSRLDLFDRMADALWNLVHFEMRGPEETLMIYNRRSKTYRPATILQHMQYTDEEFIYQFFRSMPEMRALTELAYETGRTIIVLHDNPIKLLTRVSLFITKVGLDKDAMTLHCGEGKLIFVDPTYKDPYEFRKETRALVYIDKGCDTPESEFLSGWYAMAQRDKGKIEAAISSYAERMTP